MSRATALRIFKKHPTETMFSTFIKKVSMFQLWPMVGLWDGNELAAAICWKFTKSQPKTASIQILYTFKSYRRLGCAKRLCKEFFTQSKKAGAVYFRISSESDAREFYESLGVQFLGVQKSGCLLSVGKLGRSFRSSVYDLKDPVVKKSVYRKGKGGCVAVYNKSGKLINIRD